MLSIKEKICDVPLFLFITSGINFSISFLTTIFFAPHVLTNLFTWIDNYIVSPMIKTGLNATLNQYVNLNSCNLLNATEFLGALNNSQENITITWYNLKDNIYIESNKSLALYTYLLNTSSIISALLIFSLISTLTANNRKKIVNEFGKAFQYFLLTSSIIFSLTLSFLSSAFLYRFFLIKKINSVLDSTNLQVNNFITNSSDITLGYLLEISNRYRRYNRYSDSIHSQTNCTNAFINSTTTGKNVVLQMWAENNSSVNLELTQSARFYTFVITTYLAPVSLIIYILLTFHCKKERLLGSDKDFEALDNRYPQI